MKFLVTGGSGFIGSHLVEELAVDKNNKVKILDINKPNINFETNVEFIQGSISNIELLEYSLKDVDIVFHIAWSTIPQTSNNNIIFDIESNLVNTIHFLDLCVKNKVKKVIFTSSGGTVYGNVLSNPITEDHSTNPISSYGITKLAVEKYLNIYYRLHKLDYAVLRCSNPYGERQNYLKSQGLIISLLYKIVKNEPFHIWGNGEVVRDYIYIKDLVNAHVKAIGYTGINKVFNIGSGNGLSINEVIIKIKKLLNIDFEVTYDKSRNCDVDTNVLSIEKASSELGWSPKYNFESAVMNTWIWINKEVKMK